MKTKLLGLFIVLALLGASWSSALAQNYSFSVPKEDVTVSIDAQGTATIEYTYIFQNDPSASPIDVLDIGTPNDTYNLGSITADINGQPIRSIEVSPYIPHGVALNLGSNAIQPGQSGTIHMTIPGITGILFPGTQKENEPYASFQFMPNYFDSSFVNGKTNMTVTIVLPPGMTADLPTYYNPKGWPGDAAPQSGFTSDNRVYYTWQSDQASAAKEYTFGGGFPVRFVPTEVVAAAPVSASGSRSVSFDTNTLCCVGFGLLFGGIFIFAIYSSIWGAKKRKLKYLSPKVTVEGHGIKRGLTSVEAAILLEEPVDKVMTMILFSTIKKGAATVVSRDPLKLDVEDPLPSGLQPYEVDFLTAMKETNAKEQRKKLQDVTVNLIKGLEGKMKGFSHKETVAYYKDITERAWSQVQAADTPEMKMEKFDEYMGWTMLDRDFNDRTQRTFSGGPVFIPMWWGRFDPTYRGTTGTSGGGGMASSTPSTGGKTTINLPNLPGSDFAASMINGVQAFSAGVIGDLTNFTGAITNRTNPLPPTSTQRSNWRGGGGGGGHSCACACACAGCACACAGGGR